MGQGMDGPHYLVSPTYDTTEMFQFNWTRDTLKCFTKITIAINAVARELPSPTVFRSLQDLWPRDPGTVAIREKFFMAIPDEIMSSYKMSINYIYNEYLILFKDKIHGSVRKLLNDEFHRWLSQEYDKMIVISSSSGFSDDILGPGLSSGELGKLRELFPALLYPVVCPVREFHAGDYERDLFDVIVHLNDKHRWTRERIADWLETLDTDIQLRKDVPDAEFNRLVSFKEWGGTVA